MDREELKKLRQYYHSLLGQQRIFDESKGRNVDQFPANILVNELNEIMTTQPNLLPKFKIQDYYQLIEENYTYYDADGIRAYLCTAIARLKIAIDEPTQTPITETREFSFINNIELQTVLKRDFLEIQRAYIAECWKSVIILSGGAVEAILADLLLTNSSQAIQATNAPNKKDITKWNLSELINVSAELKLVSAGVEKLSHTLREYRNLVHPGMEIRDKLTFDAEEAKIALEVLNILYRNLSE